MTDRSYTDEELALIIRRAARLHDSALESRHSLEDVQQIAEQVGLPPDVVAAAAEEVGRRAPEGPAWRMLFGPPVNYAVSAIVPGRVTPDAYPELLEAIRTELKVAGSATQVGSALEWTAGRGRNGISDLMILTVVPGKDATRIRIEANLEPMRIGTLVSSPWISGAIGLIVSIETGAAPLTAAAITAGAMSLGWMLTRAVWRRLARPVEARLERLRQIVVSHIGTLSGSRET